MQDLSVNIPAAPRTPPTGVSEPVVSGAPDRDQQTCSSGARERLAGKRVLIVEDEALLAMDLQFAFEDEGAEVIGPALSLEHALRAISSAEAIDGAILDVDLAGRDVYPVARKLTERGVPFVFHTGHGSRIKLAEMFPGSITCTKPTLPETLIDTLLRLAR